MAIEVGDQIPDVTLRVLDEGGMPAPVQSGEMLGSGKVVLFAVPGAFTPGCSNVHLPGYIEGASELAGKGVDKIVCVSVNDAWTMNAWAQAQGAEGIEMAADGNGDFAEAMGLVMDVSGVGLGSRSRRYAAVIEDGTVTALEVEPAGGIDVSSCASILGKL
ncbi:MAG: peroxiredoxin [Acidimicrobiaceae bacterium]|uniref:peroxiredoxin n=1 Tax=Candidatus Poriferisodalis multihospitum TaxID=2983191 RepID=UPI00239AE4F1|nr:peroxiredoxin [Candidatus Poriferisodalis multihospitum]MDE0134546.1 peroxiredoxin [Acidimicrobiaceae bacterium]MDE0499507.1 peroxiredoxin [Acidimicrobiaceae bacterium]